MGCARCGGRRCVDRAGALGRLRCAACCPAPGGPTSCPPPHTQPPPLAHQAHTNVDVVVDIPAFRALLADRLPLVFKGWPVEAAALPWPVQEGAEEEEAYD